MQGISGRLCSGRLIQALVSLPHVLELVGRVGKSVVAVITIIRPSSGMDVGMVFVQRFLGESLGRIANSAHKRHQVVRGVLLNLVEAVLDRLDLLAALLAREECVDSFLVSIQRDPVTEHHVTLVTRQ